MMVSSRPARTTLCTGRRGAPAEAFSATPLLRPEKASAGAPRRPVQQILCAGRDETTIRIIPRIPPIIPLALQAWLDGSEWPHLGQVQEVHAISSDRRALGAVALSSVPVLLGAEKRLAAFGAARYPRPPVFNHPPPDSGLGASLNPTLRSRCSRLLIIKVCGQCNRQTQPTPNSTDGEPKRRRTQRTANQTDGEPNRHSTDTEQAPNRHPIYTQPE